jgi:hypothetical protein
MKTLIAAVAALGVGGAFYFGGDSPDFEQVIDRPQMSVYAAFSHAAQEGPITGRGRNGFAGRTVARIRKERGELIHYEVLNEDNQAVMTAELRFAPEGDGGAATRMTAELDIDAEALGATDTGGAAAAALTESFIDYHFAALMGELASDVEKGRTLQPLPLTRLISTPSPTEARTAAQRASDSRQAQRQAARPMTTARPMVDPNQAARDHIRANQPAGNGWSR